MADGSRQIVVARKVRPRIVADLFCGAGGLSTGAARALRALGLPMQLIGVNHWDVAIETNKRNHPEHAQRIHCADLETAKPLELVPEGYLDLLLAAPSCVFHSRARGGRPVNDQQRMDPWHVVRWCTELRVKRLLVENVPEFVDWGPCSLVTGRPIASRKGEYFRAWIAALESIGNRVKWGVHCAADYGDPTTRRRFMLIACSDGKPLNWPMAEYARHAVADLLGQREKWRGAREIIDWDLRGTSIFTRKKPLKPNTIRRILAGATRYGWPQPYVDALQALLDGREPVLDVPAESMDPLLLRFRGTHAHAIEHSATDIDTPVPTLTANGSHVGLVMATGAGGVARDIEQPIPTVTAGGDGGARPHFATPLLMGVQGTAQAKPVDEPAPTITTGGGSSEKRPGNARPQLIEPLVAPYYGGGSGLTASPTSEPVPAVTTKARFGLVVPVSNSSNVGVPRSTDEPIRTITTAKGGDQAFASPLILPMTHHGGRRVDDVNEPLPTITGANRGELAIAQPGGHGYRIDIHYRMLHWRELARATSFDDEGEVYDFVGNGTEITKQIGNAVPCRMGKALVRALMADA
jgi:DNA (cytosine-5)-methyltransferase 1